MTIRKLLLITVLLIALVSVSINSLIFGSLTDRFFVSYLKETYEIHVEQIIEYSRGVLINDDRSDAQLVADLETHLVDPIFRIRLFDSEGRLLADVSTSVYGHNMMMGGGMQRMISSENEETELYSLLSDDLPIGDLYITRHSSTDNSYISRFFKNALISNSLIAALIAMGISATIGIYLSKTMSRDLKDTAAIANEIQESKSVRTEKSFISEITSIRGSLEDLSYRLRIKHRSRKEITDKLIHETRTPLTILKTHIEGIEDGVIDVDSKEIEVLRGQVDNIISIISDLGSLIDAEQSSDSVVIEEFEISKILRQIVNGLKAQFDKKGIELSLLSDEKIFMETDKFKLSQIVYNLLTNAYKFTKSGGFTKIDYHISDEDLIIQIEDNGVGIDKKDLDRIFEAYYRVESNNTSGEGIGLFVVKENLRILQGNIQIISDVGEGSKFVITIPKVLIKE